MSARISQPSTQKDLSIGAYIVKLNKELAKFQRGSKTQPDRERLEKAMDSFCQNDFKRLRKCVEYLDGECQKDENKLFCEFTELLLLGIDHICPARTEFRCQVLLFVLDHLWKFPVELSVFITLYNAFLNQTLKITPDELLRICDTVTDKLARTCDATNIYTRWRDCVVVVLRRLMEIAVLSQRQSSTGSETASLLMKKWLRECKSAQLFPHIIQIVKEVECAHIIKTFIRVDLQDAFDKFENLSEDEKSIWSIRAIELLEKGEEEEKSDKEERMRILKALMSAWTVSEEAKEPSMNMNPSLLLFIKYLYQSPSIGKQLLALFKSDRSHFFKSEFTFAALIALVEDDRYGSTAMTELKRSMTSTFKMEESCGETAWLRAILPHLTSSIRLQQHLLLLRMKEEKEWRVLSKPLMSLSYALLETTPQGSTTVSLCNGRVSSGPLIWTFASDTLLAVIRNKPLSESVGRTLLPRLLEAISTIGNSNAALLLIDVLVAVVRANTADILNNSNILERVPEYISRIRREVAVPLVRALMPILHQRMGILEKLTVILKRDILHDKTVSSALPLLLLLFHSLSPSSSSSTNSSQFSQSFATFSSQSLLDMSCSRTRDVSLCHEIIGCLKRCLSQPSSIRAVLYLGIAEAVVRDNAIAERSLDQLVGHSSSLPELNAQSLVISTDSLCELTEALPQFIYAVNSLINEVLKSSEENMSEGGDELVTKATEILNLWSKKAASLEMDELALDKLADWNKATKEGRTTLLFAHCMKGVYDALIEFLWMRVHLFKYSEATEWLNAILKRRKEVVELLKDKIVRRKDIRAAKNQTSTVHLDEKQGDVPVHLSTLADAIWCLVKEEPDESLSAMDLLQWTVHKTLAVSETLDNSSHTTNLERISTKDVIIIMSNLLNLYKGGNDCAKWLSTVECGTPLKTEAITAYSHLLQWILSRRRTKMEEIAVIWMGEKEDNSGTNTQYLMRHVHQLTAKLLPALITLEKSGDEGEEKNEKRKEEKMEMEKQAKAIIKMVETLIRYTVSDKAAMTALNLCVSKIMEKNSPNNLTVLRELLKLVRKLAKRCSREDSRIDRLAIQLNSQVIGMVKDEAEEDTWDSVSPYTIHALTDFLFGLIEDDMASITSLLTFSSYFSTDEENLNMCIEGACKRGNSSLTLVTSLLPLYNLQQSTQPKITALLTLLFSTLDVLVKTITDASKHLSVSSWTSLDSLSAIVSLLSKLLAEVDINVGVLNKEDDEGKKSKRNYTRAKKDEGLFIKFVRARESVQSRFLILSKTLKDSRFNLVVKNNSIGLRDFRINVKMLEEKMKRASELDVSLAESTQTKRRKKEETSQRSPVI